MQRRGLRGARAEIDALEPHLHLLYSMGCNVLVLCETTGAVHGNRNAPLSTRPTGVRSGTRLESAGDRDEVVEEAVWIDVFQIVGFARVVDDVKQVPIAVTHRPAILDDLVVAFE